jgi:DHA3 family tetracycline resistance protein-like MFS transporter
MEGQLNAVGQIAGGPPLGAVGNRVSVRGALVVSGLVFAPVIWLYGRLAPTGTAAVDNAVQAQDI